MKTASGMAGGLGATPGDTYTNGLSGRCSSSDSVTGGKSQFSNDEIHFDELADWMDQRGVSGVEEVKKNIFRDEYLDRFHNRK